MRDDVLAHLHDILKAARAVKGFSAGRTYAEYAADELLRSAVERKSEIMGEGLNRISRDDPACISRIREYRDIISFRNILIHGYDAIDNRIVWGVIEEDLDNLIEDEHKLRADPDTVLCKRQWRQDRASRSGIRELLFTLCASPFSPLVALSTHGPEA